MRRPHYQGGQGSLLTPAAGWKACPTLIDTPFPPIVPRLLAAEKSPPGYVVGSSACAKPTGYVARLDIALKIDAQSKLDSSSPTQLNALVGLIDPRLQPRPEVE